MKNKAKPDDRRDNVEKIQYNINHTISNYRETKDMIQATDDEKMKEELIKKNKRRLESIKGMREEIKDEAAHRDNQLKG